MALVVWSGGCDSTLVLHDVAKEQGGARALSVRHFQVLAAEESAAARGKLLARFKKMGLNIEHSTVKVDQEDSWVQGYHCDGGLAQPILWLSMAVSYLTEDEDLYFGYHKGDDFWTFSFPFADAFRALQKVRGGKGKLRYPLEHLHKADILKRLQALGLYRDCWYCETPRRKPGKRCGKCRPCITHRTALWQLSEGLA